MKPGLNLGAKDRWLRVVAGLVLIYLAFSPVFQETLAMIAYVIGAVLILTAALKFCPAYSVIGINTDARES